MPLIVTQGALVRLIWAQSGINYAVNVYGAINTASAAITQTTANTLGSAIKAAFSAGGAWNTQVGTSVTLANVGIRDVSAPNRPEFLDAGAAVAGTAAGNLAPLNTAICVTLRTALAGRSFRGRTYLSGLTTAAVSTGGLITGPVQAAAKAWVDAVDAAMGANGFPMAVISRTRNVANDVTLTQTRDALWDTQRRRTIPGI